ncbi:MAG: TRAP transporter substrate-binding protein [Sphaerochaetaceae bacterium]|nr:TRAP transporter substrate-binding protein [Sphaerochaetaceae bacterium]
MKKVLVALLVLFTMVSVFAAGSAEQSGTKVLKLGSTSPAGSNHEEALVYFQTRLREVSGGKLDVSIHMAGALGNTAQHFAQLQEGTLDIFLCGFDTSATLREGSDFAVVCVPFAFNDMDHYQKFVESDICKNMISKVEKANGLHFFGLITPSNPRTLSTTNKPISSVADVKNMKIRVPETQAIFKMWESIGANPVIISGGELYAALQSGLADAQDNDVVASQSSGFGEVLKYFTEIDYIQQALVTWFSEITWNSLSAEEQGWLNTALAQTFEGYGQITRDGYAGAKQALIDQGVTFCDVDVESFRKAAAEAVKAMDGVLFTKGLYDQIRALAN